MSKTSADKDPGELLVPQLAIRLVYFTVFMDLMGTYISQPVLPFYAQSFGANAVDVGYLFTAPAVAAVFSAPYLGKLADRYGRRPLLLISLLGACIGSVAQGFAPSYVVLLVGRFFTGIWMNSQGTAQVYLSDVATGLMRSDCMAKMISVKQLSMFFGPGLGGVLSRVSLNFPILANAIATAFAALVVWFAVPESPKWKEQKVAKEQAAADSDGGSKIANGNGETKAAPTPKADGEPATWQFWMCCGVAFQNAVVLVNMNAMIPMFAQRAHGFDAFHVGMMLLGACAVTLWATLTTTWLQKTFGLFVVGTGSIAGQVIFLAFMAYCQSTWGFVFFFLCSRICGAIKIATNNIILAQFTTTSNRGKLIGIKTQFENIGTMVAGPIMGWLLEFDIRLPFLASMACGIAGSFMTWAIRPRPVVGVSKEPLLGQP